MSVNDKWHYCHNSDVLVGSRAMRDRHLRLLGYVILQVSHQTVMLKKRLQRDDMNAFVR